ncbi:MFS transporter [Pseudomonas resinovorans]|uniref:MFS transporter n=1 Tax=Metapseudomonas resinovorans TaxID=53412 RepID=A0ABT4Y8Z6_METRE|nr:MFS transporter [Pseudomonas resinovorans]MDA8485343.1 MFS transporter [Pseudomonas resinovorans]
MLLNNPSIRLLFVGQALYWSCSMIGITLTSLVGLQLAPINSLATLPLALLVLGNLLAVQPLSLFMQRHGRRRGLMLGATCGVLGGLLSALGVWLGDFVLFCLGALPIGGYQASAMYYRFAALEAVEDTQKGRATAYVIGGGVCAALITPSLSLWSRTALDAPFVGAYLLIAVLALIALLLMSRLREGEAPRPPKAGWAEARSLLSRPQVRAALATTAIGHGLMVLVMNATPLAMSFCGHSLESSTEVIRWHMLGMFLPAFIAGPLVDRLGSRRVALLGGLVLLVSAVTALSGLGQAHFLVSSFLLGVGWNLMLVAGTTLLGEGHSAEERGQAQGLMELGNGLVAAGASFTSGALISGIGWDAVNLGMLPLLAVALLMLVPVRSRLAAG